MKILLRWFNLNSPKANPGMFWFRPIYIYPQTCTFFGGPYEFWEILTTLCLTIGSINVKESDHVDLLEKTIGKKLSWKNFWKKALVGKHAFLKTTCFYAYKKNLTAEKDKLLWMSLLTTCSVILL